MKKEKELINYHYVQNWGTYENDTLVFIGHTRDDIIKIVKKYKDSDWIGKTVDENSLTGRGFVAKDGQRTLLWLKKWNNNWEYIQVLVHELHHLVEFILVTEKGMGGEIEALACQQEFLLRQIRTKLNDKLFKK